MISVSALKVLGFVAVGLAGAVLGYKHAQALYERDIAEIRANAEAAARELQANYRRLEDEKSNQLVKAWEERDRALSSIRDLSIERDRLRDEAGAARRRLSEARSASCKLEREQLARCADLLQRGGELAARGAELAERAAIDKDAVVKLAK